MNYRLVFLSSIAAGTLIGCQPRPQPFDSLADLVPAPPPPASEFCFPGGSTGRQLRITVNNQGNAASPPCKIKISWSNAQSGPIPPTVVEIPGIDPKKSIAVPPIDVPQPCLSPDCGFEIVVDSENVVQESNKSNNKVSGGCNG